MQRSLQVRSTGFSRVLASRERKARLKAVLQTFTSHTWRARLLPRGFALIILLLALSSPLLTQTKEPTRSGSVAFTHVTVIDATGAAAQSDMTVVVVGDRITELGPSAKIQPPKEAQVIDAKGKFLIPGLWDMHVHLGLAGESALPLFIANGITSVRDMGGEFEPIKRWREKIAQGQLIGPRIKAAGPILESARFVQMMEKNSGQSQAKFRVGVGSPEEAAKAVNYIAGLGVDFLKIRTNASRQAYLAIAAEAKRVGLPLVGHAPNGVSLVEVSDAGQRSIEHGLVFLNKLTDAEWKEVAARFVKNGTYVVPTLIAGRGFRDMPDEQIMAVIDDQTNTRDPRRQYIPPVMIVSWRRQIEAKKSESPLDWEGIKERNQHGLREVHRGGVAIMAGTDFGVPLTFPGFSLHEELERLVTQVGLTPMQALQSATRTPAEFFNLRESLGTVEKGKLADLVLLEANPLDNISNTQKIAAVVVSGKLIQKSELQALAAKAAEANKK